MLLGAELSSLEAELDAAVHGAPTGCHVVGVSSGASASQLALAALGVGPGDEVVVPAFTAVPTASAVCATGAVPVFADVDDSTAALDPGAAAAVVTSRTKAIVVVHLYGRPADVTRCSPSGRQLSRTPPRPTALCSAVTGAAAIYSFYPTKNVGGIGDGGAVVTRDTNLAASVRRRRVHGMTEQYVHVEISQNHRLSELEAAWLRLQLPHLRCRQCSAPRRSPGATEPRRRNCDGTPTTRTTSSISASPASRTVRVSARRSLIAASPPASTTRSP